jgi:NAD(P)H dehydrogenase (quinone)
MSTYAVTAATGQLGRLVVDALLALEIPAASIVAIARDPGKLADLEPLGVTTRTADYGNPEALYEALQGVDRLLLISGNQVGHRLAEHTHVVDAARGAGVERIAYTSILWADFSTNPLAEEHLATERMIADTGLPHTFLRHGWYTENYTDQIPQYMAAREIVTATGGATLATAARGDFAAADAFALVNDTAEEVVWELAGPGWTMTEFAAEVSLAAGREILARDVTPAELVERSVAAGAPEAGARFGALIDASIAAGQLDAPSEPLRLLLQGRAPLTMPQIVAASQH